MIDADASQGGRSTRTPAPKPARKAGGRGPRVRAVPVRTCIACRTARGKRELIRLVRTAEGQVEIDATGKKSGRGAYLCRYRQCWDAGLERRRLDHALKLPISAENRQALARFAAQLPLTPPPGG